MLRILVPGVTPGRHAHAGTIRVHGFDGTAFLPVG
jgi:hypothetical protein